MNVLAEVGLILTYLISPIPAPETTITLTMQMEEVGAAMVGVEAELLDRTDDTIVYGSCVSDGAGICVLEINDTIMPEVVRGRLDLGISGARTFIVERGKDQSLIVPFTEFGKVVGGVNHEPHPTVESFQPEEVPTELPPVQAAVTQIPTTELVVVDPDGYQTMTPGPKVDQIAEVIETAVPVTLTVEDGELSITQDETSGRNWIVVAVVVLLFILAWGIGIVIYWRNTDAK